MNFKAAILLGLLSYSLVSGTEEQDAARMGAMTEEELELQQMDIVDVDDEMECNGTAVYKVVFDFVWSSNTHPTDYPATAHWSPVSGTVHNSNYRMWGADLLATPGVQQVAETGANSILKSEIEDCGDDCSEMFVFECDEFAGTCVSAGEVEVTVDKPRFSAISMIAPSPDWFVGIHDLELCKFAQWVPFYSADLLAYDSDTDLGTTYASPNAINPEPGLIFFIDNEEHVLYHPEDERINAFGNFTIELMEIKM
eukprot:TRINITY_DN7450_c0_g1_i1.p9 TRINITY_DN7450_c0_g1~~TRINITY_DN7450_c0_g1_i1.p9  ORF type:complete len:254 (-),score=45.40 TRINITY_DN7450_c0_g1_i1:372-1133(-)